MRIEKIALHNWQCYKGRGKNATIIDLRGDTTGRKSSIIYGQNTRGKTAFWEAVRFALYGRVPKRMSTLEERRYKPITAASSDKEPLLNVRAFHEGDFMLSVDLWFDVRGSKFHLARQYSIRSGIEEPNSDGDMEETATLRNETTGEHIRNPKQFLSGLLPEDIAQFFMFDGERLDEYRLLLESSNNIDLKNQIEKIIRLPVLTQGIDDFESVQKKYKKDVRRFEKELSSDINLRRMITGLEIDVDNINNAINDRKDRIDELNEKVEELTKWLHDNDESKRAFEQLDRYDAEITSLEEGIDREKDAIRSTLPNIWRCILTAKIDISINRLNNEANRQEKQAKKQTKLQQKLAQLERRLSNEPCGECGRPQESLDHDAQEELCREIARLKEASNALEQAKGIPDSFELHNKMISLQKIRNDSSLSGLLDIEGSILKKKADLQQAIRNRDTAKKHLTAEARRMVAEKIREKDSVQKLIGGEILSLESLAKKSAELTGKLNTKRAGLRTEGKKSLVHAKTDIAVEVLQALKEVWESNLASYRSQMRRKVQQTASDVFLTCSNNAENYQGIEISDNFSISIIGKDGRPDIGSPAQWAIIAYSMLDSLTQCSGIEFPMIIDTPGRSIDDEHCRKVFDHFFNSNRQVVLLPEGKELNPEEGDKRYGHLCASTYALEKTDGDSARVSIRVNNLCQ